MSFYSLSAIPATHGGFRRIVPNPAELVRLPAVPGRCSSLNRALTAGFL